LQAIQSVKRGLVKQQIRTISHNIIISLTRPIAYYVDTVRSLAVTPSCSICQLISTNSAETSHTLEIHALIHCVVKYVAQHELQNWHNTLSYYFSFKC